MAPKRRTLAKCYETCRHVGWVSSHVVFPLHYSVEACVLLSVAFEHVWFGPSLDSRCRGPKVSAWVVSWHIDPSLSGATVNVPRNKSSKLRVFYEFPTHTVRPSEYGGHCRSNSRETIQLSHETARKPKTIHRGYEEKEGDTVVTPTDPDKSLLPDPDSPKLV